jgi:hypothetical protein
MATTKKTSKKVTKKVSSKTKSSRTSKKKNQSTLVCADGPHCFWVSDGRVLANLTDLRDALAQMKEDVYYHHVTKEKNDFADWVESVLYDDELANALRRSQKPHTARALVVRRLRVHVA